jgi:outer membrane cobalamin receptor
MLAHSLVGPSTLALAALLLLPACGANQQVTHRRSDGGGRVITAEQIRRSGATDAWDALRRVGTHLSMRESSQGQPARLGNRGQSSLLLPSEPLVVIDGVRMIDFRSLNSVPAEIIASIRILAGHEGTTRYGTGAGSGVIVVETRPRPF